MTFADLPAGVRVFVDANPLIYHFSPHPTFGPACHQLITSIESQTFIGYTTTHVLAEVAHALMVVEALSIPGWSLASVPKRLKKHPPVVQQLTVFQNAVVKVLQSRLQVLTVRPDLMLNAAAISRQFGLLTNDALVVAIMQDQNIVALASHDGDFDRVPMITRYSPY